MIELLARYNAYIEREKRRSPNHPVKSFIEWLKWHQSRSASLGTTK